MFKFATLVLLSLTLLSAQPMYCQSTKKSQASIHQHRKKKKARRKMNDRTIVQRGEVTTSMLPGNWGGEHIKLKINEAGGHLEFDCAHGTVSRRIMLNGKNHFDVEGVYVREHGGPERPGEKPDSHTARYTGRVDGESMTISVVITDTNQSIGTFTLIRGRTPILNKCL